MADSRQHEDRAPRMEMRLPLRFRARGSEPWLESATENISRTGLLFSTDQEYSAGSVLEIDLRLPSVRAMEEQGARLQSLARIVRAVVRSDPAGRGVGLAVQFLEYQMSRRTSSDS